MLISVITPSFNSGDFIERAILSVAEQDYPHWEHIVVDGGSTDGTLDILKKYPHLRWISEPDNGQADAMNKGFARSRGDIVVYLNADDYFFPGAFSAVVPEFEKGASFVVGNVLIKSERLGAEFLNTPRITLEGMLRHWEPNAFCHNPVGYLYRREVQEKCPFNTANYATMDLEFLLDVVASYPFTKVEYTLGCFIDGLKTKTHQTQVQHDYWQPATFPYLDRHIARLTDEERERYLVARRAGYVEQQAAANQRSQRQGLALSPPSAGERSISVIIPAYNCREYISRVIDSVLSQEVQRLEVLIVDDASPDDVVDVVRERYGADPRVRLLHHAENKKQGAARNTGLRHVSGDYVFFLDADDWLEPGALKALLSIAEHYKADIVACGTQKAFADGRIEPYHAFAFACKGGREALWYLAEYYIGTIPWNKFYRAKFLKDNNLLFLERYYHEDVLFSMYAAALCTKYISINDNYVNYFQNDISTTHRLPTPVHLTSFLRIWPDIDKFADAYKLKDDEDGILLLKKLLYQHASRDMVPKLKRYLQVIPEEQYGKHIECACADVFPEHKEMAADILKSIFFELSANKKKHFSGMLESNSQNGGMQPPGLKLGKVQRVKQKLQGTIFYKPSMVLYRAYTVLWRKLRRW